MVVWFIFGSLSRRGPLWVISVELCFALFIGNIRFNSSSDLFFLSLLGKGTIIVFVSSELLHQAESKHKQTRAMHGVRQIHKESLKATFNRQAFGPFLFTGFPVGKWVGFVRFIFLYFFYFPCR